MTTLSIKDQALAVIRIEQEALAHLEAQLNESFEAAVALILACKGRVVVSGMGKSGHIGQKLAATLASTGTPAFFMHPAEGRHGDLGQVTPADVVIAISNSGESEEVLGLLPTLKALGVAVIGMTARPDSTLARCSRVVLDISVPREACPLALAPTSSTTVTLVLGDALAMVLMQQRGFQASDFALFHPSGSLGKRLLLTSGELMAEGDALPLCHLETPLLEALLLIGKKQLGVAVVLDANEQLAGILTDGDIRRYLASHPVPALESTPVQIAMTPNPLRIPPTQLASDALQRMQERKITALVVTDAEQPSRVVGVLHLHTLLHSGL